MQYNMQVRENTLIDWLQNIFPNQNIVLYPLAGDASFRIYKRLHINQQSFIVMDAIPEKEPMDDFIKISHLLGTHKINIPHIYAHDTTHGFMLLQDFGDILLHTQLQNSELAQTTYWYNKAFSVILNMQKCDTKKLLNFDMLHMQKEWSLFTQWFLQGHLKLDFSNSEAKLLDSIFTTLAHAIDSHPKVFIHRDFHSKNLLIHEDNLGIIDFQDAMCGSIFYDLVSLIKDCYIDFPPTQVKTWFNEYYKLLNLNLNIDAYKAFEICGIQRHCKALGIFARLNLLYKRDNYLQYIPRTLNYILQALPQYPELHLFEEFLQQKLSNLCIQL